MSCLAVTGSSSGVVSALLCSALLYVLCLLYCHLLCCSACSAVPSSSRRRCCRRRRCCCCCRCCCVRTTNALLSVCMVLTLTLGRAGGKRVLQTTDHLTLLCAGHIPPHTEAIDSDLASDLGLLRSMLAWLMQNKLACGCGGVSFCAWFGVCCDCAGCCCCRRCLCLLSAAVVCCLLCLCCLFWCLIRFIPLEAIGALGG